MVVSERQHLRGGGVGCGGQAGGGGGRRGGDGGRVEDVVLMRIRMEQNGHFTRLAHMSEL